MTRDYSIYRLSDGIIVRSMRVPDAVHAGPPALEPGEGWIEGVYDWRAVRVIDGAPVAYTPEPPAVTANQVRAEAARRIEAAWPLWRQMNTMRAGGDDYAAMGAQIDVIRSASDALEIMDPIPQDYRSDDWWP